MVADTRLVANGGFETKDHQPQAVLFIFSVSISDLLKFYIGFSTPIVYF